MKLFGPDSQTSLVAEDDDGGVGLNARIVANLALGSYFVQIRHFNTARGTACIPSAYKPEFLDSAAYTC